MIKNVIILTSSTFMIKMVSIQISENHGIYCCFSVSFLLDKLCVFLNLLNYFCNLLFSSYLEHSVSSNQFCLFNLILDIKSIEKNMDCMLLDSITTVQIMHPINQKKLERNEPHPPINIISVDEFLSLLI